MQSIKRQAAKWRKDQINDNRAIEQLVGNVDKAFESNSPSVNLLHSAFPISDFQAVRAKVRGSRYFAKIYVRTERAETAAQKFAKQLGPWFQKIELKP